MNLPSDRRLAHVINLHELNNKKVLKKQILEADVR